jgi:tRNA modification GTPase
MAEATIAAIATAPGEAGIGIIRLSGEKSIAIADSLFKNPAGKSLENGEDRKLYYGHIYDPKTDQMVDEILIVKMLGPRSYTTEDVVEIHCHGGMIPVRRILQLTLEQGAILAEPGEFTKRAFLNGRLDLSQAEAVMDLISAKTEAVYDVSLNQLNGQISSAIKELRELLLRMIAHIQVSIDYPEDDIEEVTFGELKKEGLEVLDGIDSLLSSVDTGKILRDGLKTIILGKPNVGKSSLMNAVLRENRAIVTDIPGTTRDIIEEYVNIHGIPLKIVDTAGIRDTEDLVEKMGVDRAKDLVNSADLIIAVFDQSSSLTDEDYEIINLIKEKSSIVLLNKTDLPSVLDRAELEKSVNHDMVFEISALNKTGLDRLENTLKDMFFEGDLNVQNDTIITNVRHKEQLRNAKERIEEALQTIEMQMPVDCIEVDLKACWDHLGEISGETLKEDIIDRIFSEFCVGK